MRSSFSSVFSVFTSFRVWSLMLLVVLSEATTRVPVVKRHQNNDTKALIYATFGIIVFVALLFLGYIARELCPRGPIFNAIELDEIRLDRLDDIESSLKEDINTLKNKLAFHRKKKTQVQTDRDIKRRLGERVERFNEKGRDIYGEAWESGDIPVRDVVAMTTKEVEGLRREAEVIAEKRKEEEKEDLWKLWNEVRQDGDQAAPLLSSGVKNSAGRFELNDKHALLKRGNDDGGVGGFQTPMGKSSVNAIHKQAPLSSVSRPALTFELDNGKFAAPSVDSATRGTYTYNNNTYNINNSKRNGTGSNSPGTPLRNQPPLLDLTKLSSPPAHVKPPPKPPGFNPSPSKAGAIATPSGTAKSSLLDRSSQRPSMRSYAPGTRPAPPAGPKPPPRPNPDAVNNSSNNGGDGSGVGNPLLNSLGGSGGSGSGSTGPVKIMKRPPPPLMAPPPGYIPGNSSRGGHLRNSARGSARMESTVSRSGEHDHNEAEAPKEK